jgi:hypothetical protein
VSPAEAGLITFQAIGSSRSPYVTLPAPAKQTQYAKPSAEKRESSWKRDCCDREARNLPAAVARAPVDDPKEIRSAEISEGCQRYCVEAISKVHVVTKLNKAARPGSVAVNEELEKRTRLIVLSSYLD